MPVRAGGILVDRIHFHLRPVCSTGPRSSRDTGQSCEKYQWPNASRQSPCSDFTQSRNACLSGNGKSPVVLAKITASYCCSAAWLIFSARTFDGGIDFLFIRFAIRAFKLSFIRLYPRIFDFECGALLCSSSASTFSAVGMELWRNPVVTVTTSTFLGAAMPLPAGRA